MFGHRRSQASFAGALGIEGAFLDGKFLAAFGGGDIIQHELAHIGMGAVDAAFARGKPRRIRLPAGIVVIARVVQLVADVIVQPPLGSFELLLRGGEAGAVLAV